MVRWTERAGELPALALEEAERLGHRYLGTEHLLLALLRQEGTPAANLLRAHGVELEATRAEVDRLVASGALPAPRPSDGELLATVGIDLDTVYRRATQAFRTTAYYQAAQRVRTRSVGAVLHTPMGGTPLLIRRVLLLACDEAVARGQQVTAEHVLLGLLRDAEDPSGAGLLPPERRLCAHLGLPEHGPHPVRLLLEGLGTTPEALRAAVLRRLDGVR